MQDVNKKKKPLRGNGVHTHKKKSAPSIERQKKIFTLKLYIRCTQNTTA